MFYFLFSLLFAIITYWLGVINTKNKQNVFSIQKDIQKADKAIEKVSKMADEEKIKRLDE